MLFEQSGSVWLWWVCISRLESEGGRGGRAFRKKHSALFRPRLIGQCSAISTALCGLVRSEIHVRGRGGDARSLSNAAKKKCKADRRIFRARRQNGGAAAAMLGFQQSGASALPTSSRR